VVSAAAPNILLIVADDLGTDFLRSYEPYYPDLPTDPPPPPTPALDWLADEGLLFTDCWTSPSCTPSRAQIMTGRYSHRTGMGALVLAQGSATGLQQSEITLPQILRKQMPAYANAAVGKWHLGPSNQPEDWGHALGRPASTDGAWFDLWAGSLYNLQTGPGSGYNRWQKTFATSIDPQLDECGQDARMPCQILLDENTTVTPSPGEYATVDTIDDAIALIGTLPEPWFLYVAFNAPHRPANEPAAPPYLSSCLGFTTDPTCDFDGDFKVEARCMVQWMDNEIGRLLCDLDAEGLTDRSVVFFIGDNGTAGDRYPDGTTGVISGAVAAPFDPDHGKGTLFQGGVNVPMIVKGPGVVHGVCHELVSSTDLLATFAEVAGSPKPNHPAEDSVSFAPYLRGRRTPLRETMLVEKFGPNFIPTANRPPANYRPTRHQRAIRDAQYKLIRNEVEAADGSIQVVESFYNLYRPVAGGAQVDPFEQDDLRSQITPGGFTPMDRAYDQLHANMQVLSPSLFR
jgi:arylsulfatase A-like enzyme